MTCDTMALIRLVLLLRSLNIIIKEKLPYHSDSTIFVIIVFLTICVSPYDSARPQTGVIPSQFQLLTVHLINSMKVKENNESEIKSFHA